MSVKNCAEEGAVLQSLSSNSLFMKGEAFYHKQELGKLMDLEEITLKAKL